MATDRADAAPPRPMRADARRNHERIVAAAREVFTEQGVEAPMDEIVKRAQVGAGTLYRHFPSRETILEAVYRDGIDRVSSQAHGLLDDHPPDVALAEWVRALVRYYAHQRGLTASLKGVIDENSETFAHCKAVLRGAAEAVLTAARDAGLVSAEAQPRDLLLLAHGVGDVAGFASAEETERLVTVVLRGLRP